MLIAIKPKKRVPLVYLFIKQQSQLEVKQYKTCQHEDFKVSEEQRVHREGHRLLFQILTIPSINEAVPGFW